MNLKKCTIHYSYEDEAVSEIISTLLLVTMAVVMFSAIVIMVLNPWTNYSDDSPPLVTILGSVQGDRVILEHQGGVNLDGKTRITITIANVDHSFVLGGSPYFIDSNNDGKWNVGENVVYTAANLQNTQVKCIIVDTENNAIVMDKTIQQGNMVLFPYVTILDPIDVNKTSATLYMYYNFINQNYFSSGYLNFTYGPNGGPYTATTAVKPFMMEGWYSLTITGLNQGSLYECWAYLRYTGGKNLSGPLFFYTYQDTRGIWHLDEAPGDTIAHDAVTPYCNGNVQDATFISGGKINNSLHFEGASQYVDVPHHPKLNITNDITIKTWLNLTMPLLAFPGNISDVTDAMNLSGNFSTTCYEPEMIHVESSKNDNIYAMVYHDNSSACVSTIPINTNGQIQNIIQTISLGITHFLKPDVIHISGDVYAIAFGTSEIEVEKKGHIVTVSIDDDGNIAQLSTFDFDTYYGKEPKILHVSGTTYAIVYGGCSLSHTLQTGKLFTVTIDTAGNIGNHTIDELKFPENYCSEAEIIQITNDIFAITYNGIDEKQGYIRTVKILPTGQIVNGTFIDSFQFGLPSDWLEPSIIHVSGDVFAISYGADSNNQDRNGFIQTVCIRSDGTIQHSIISSLAFPTPYSFETKIESVGNDVYAIAYSGGDSFEVERGFLSTVDIDSTGNISGSVDDLYEFLGYKGLGPSIINLFGHSDQFVLVYGAGTLSAHGFMITVKIDQVGSPQWVLQKGDMFGIKVNGNRVIATMTIGGASHTVSGVVSLPWNHLVLSYATGLLTLKINGAVSQDGSVSCSGTIKTNLDSLIFGNGFYGSLDEVEIYSIYKP